MSDAPGRANIPVDGHDGARVHPGGAREFEPGHHALPGATTTREAVVTVHEVPPEPPPIRGHDPRRGIDSVIIPVLFALLYGVLGYFVVSDGRIVSFDALNRLNEAYMVWWNAPPKLAAISLDMAPLGALAFLPLTLVKPLATSLVALPVLSAIGAGITVGAVNSIMRRCGFPAALRFVLLILFGLNPMFVYYAGNGEPLMLGLAAASVGVLSLISWKVTGETRHVVGAGLGISIAAMFDYGYALWAIGFVIAILAISAGRKDSSDRIRSTLLVFLTPVVYAFAVWILLNLILTGSPFGWVTAQAGTIQVNTTGVLQGVTASVGGSLSDLFRVVLAVAPLGFLSVLLMIAMGAARRSRLAIGLLFVMLAAVLVPLIRALVANQADLMDLSVGLPLVLLAAAGTAYAYHGESGWRGVSVVTLVIGLVAALPLGWIGMKNYRFQNQAEAFTRYIGDRASQEGSASVGGYTVGLDPELTMARRINELPARRDGILVDENFSYGVMLTSGRPDLFLDRADRGEDNWRAVLDSPWGKVRYMLITTSRAGDQLRKKWPAAVEGGEPGMTPVFRTDRYVLVEISETRPETEADGNGFVPQSTPRPVTPQRPTVPSRDGGTPPPTTGSGTATPDPGGTTQPDAAPDPSATPGRSSAPTVEGE